MIGIRKKNEAFDILKAYNGENPYILKLQKSVYIDRNNNAMTDYQADFILHSHNAKPKEINRVIKIADWWGEKKKEDWLIDFTPKVIKVITYLGETENTYVCYIQYRLSLPPVICHIPKSAVLTNFLVEDYNKREVDFDRYTRLSKSMGANRELLEHQKTAVKFLLTRKKCILADEQGLGKTTSVCVAAIEGNFDTVLIICPAGLKSNWRRELMNFVPERDITIIESFTDKSKAELEDFLGYAIGKSNMKKEELLAEAKEKGKWKDNRFVIINYDILDEFFSNKRTYNAVQFDQLLSESPMLNYINNKKSLIIVDEAHSLSNSKSIRYKTIRGLVNKGKPDSLYLITGTPMTNDPSNLYCVLNLLDDPVTKDWKKYMERYCDAKEFCTDRKTRNRLSDEFIIKKGKASWYDLTKEEREELNEWLHNHRLLKGKFILSPQGGSNLDELKARISHIYLRRLQEVLKLPKKNIHEIYYDLTPVQKQRYEELWDEYVAEKELQNSNEDEELEMNKHLLEGGVYRQYLSIEMVPNTIKMADEHIARGEKVVIACCFDDELYQIKDYYGDRCVIFNGKTNSKQKDEAIMSFTNDDNVMVFIGNIASAGVGITLIKSHVLIFNDFDYVPSSNKQMQDRIYRIGQQHDVDIYYQIFKDTQYERMWDINIKKEAVIESVIKKEEEKDNE